MINKIKSFLKSFPRHWVVAASAWGSRIVTSLISIISIRTILLYLGEERYAVYAITYSLSAWFSFCELGIGSSLQNFISESRAKNESYDKYIKSALQLICILVIVFLAITIAISPFIQDKLFIKYLNISEVQNINIVGIIGCIFVITALVNIVYKIYFALQKGYVSNILPAVSMIVSMTAIVFINRYLPIRANITIALLAFTVPQLLIALIPFIKIFKPFFTKIFDLDKDIMKNLLIRSLKFFGPAVMGVITLQIDYIIMSNTVEYMEVATYNIFNKFFILFLFLHSALLAAAWPVCSELFNKGIYKPIKSMIFKYIAFGSLIVITGTFATYKLSGVINSILAPGIPLRAALSLFVLFGTYYLLRVWSDTFGMFLNSINALRVFWIFIPFQAVISVSAQYFLSLRFGIKGILMGLIISFLLTSCWILPYKAWKVFKSKENLNAV